MENQNMNVFKLDGVNLYFIDDMVFICSNGYSHFFKLEDAFNYYQQLQKIIKMKIVFDFFDYEFCIDDNTTLEDINNQLRLQKLVMKDEIDESKKKKENFYLKYLSEKSDSRSKLLYKVDFPMVKKYKK